MQRVRARAARGLFEHGGSLGVASPRAHAFCTACCGGIAASLDDERRAEFKRAMIAWHETVPSPLGYDQPRRYLITRGVRR